MKEVIINEVFIENFKSQTNYIKFDKFKTTIEGANGVGKSTIYKAVLWCLTGYTDATNVKNHELYDNKYELNQYTPKAKVKLSVSIDGEKYLIERSATAKFIRKRGSAIYEKASSDNYKYIIDDIEYSLTEFNEWIKDKIAPVELLIYCINGEFFSNLAEEDKNKARNLLENLIGSINISDFKENYELIDIKNHSIDELKSKYKTIKKPIENRLNEIPAIIASKKKDMSVLDNSNTDDIVSKIDEITLKIKDVDDKLSGKTSSISSYIKLREEAISNKSKLQMRLHEKRIEYSNKETIRRSEIQIEIDKIKAENCRIEERNKILTKEYSKLENSLEIARTKKKELEELRKILVNKKEDVKNSVFNETKCYFCGQDLPQDIIQDELKKFEEQKVSKLNCIVAEGKDVRRKLDIVNEEIDNIEKEINKGLELLPLKSYDELTLELNSNNQIPFEKTEEYILIQKEIDEFEIPDIPEVDLDDLKIQRSCLSEELDTLKEKLINSKVVENQIEKLYSEIKDLEKEQKECVYKISENERLLNLCNMYEEEKANIVAERVNKHLDYCIIVMSEKQKNGEYTPSCTICSKDGVKFSTLNNSSRLNINIQIQLLFSKLLDIKMPCFVDEASVFDKDHLPSLETQMIYFRCSDDKKIKVTYN